MGMPRVKGRKRSAIILNSRYKPKTCQRCGRVMDVISGNTKYCKWCKPIIKAEQRRRCRLNAQAKRGA